MFGIPTMLAEPVARVVDHPCINHVDLSTTEIYARASTEAKRRALEAAYVDVVSADLAEWNQNPELLDWLASL